MNRETVKVKDIVDIASSDDRFSTLVAAIKATGLVDTLKGQGPFTVFAPTDQAFSKLPAGTLDSLMQNKSKLKDILLYHVVRGDVRAADVMKMSSADTVQGESLSVRTSNGKVMINDAQVIMPDIEAANGVIHVIDSVLMPSQR